MPENEEFVKEVVQDRYSALITNDVNQISVSGKWEPGMTRTGVIAKKIGCYPLWLKDGTQISTTLLQVY